LNSRRFDGCTLTGALAITTQVTDGITIVHGPAGCAHHNFSLLHATMQDNGDLRIPNILSSRLGENDIIFGGEDALERAISSAVDRGPASVFVISTCVIETIGDDVAAVCARNWEIPVIHVPTSGFLGGAFHQGCVNALIAIAELAGLPRRSGKGVNLIGEKNLEYEVEENYQEMERLLSMVDLPIRMRYIRGVRTADLAGLGAGELNLLREPGLKEVGVHLKERFGTPFISSSPIGLEGTLAFLSSVGEACGIDCIECIEEEKASQENVIEEFSDLKGERVSLYHPYTQVEGDTASDRAVQELISRLQLRVDAAGAPIPFPIGAPVGTSGIRRLLHRWRRAVHA
jgi:nitrogenase molybdenum-iron protein alpha/beta subunit